MPVLFDSGIRCGADIAKALALGADAVLLGRPYLWGLALDGQAGVEAVLRMILAELDLTLALSGYRTPGELSRASLERAVIGGGMNMDADPGANTPTIYEWAGARAAFERWLNAFYDLVEEDDLLAPMFGGRVTAEHRRNVVTWWCEVMGGPAAYTEEHGGYEHMLGKHRGLGITSEQRLRFVTLLSRAADDAGLPADPEFRAAIMGYAEWGTRLALHNSQPDAAPAAHAPVPLWGWGVAPPYRP